MHVLPAVTPASEPANPFGWVPAVLIVLAIIGLLVGLNIYRERVVRRDAQDVEIAALTRHHTPHWTGDYRTFRAEPRHWGLAVAAPFALCAGEDWDRLLHKDVVAVREGIAEAWGIQNRVTMLRQLYSLLSSGHRESFSEEIAVWSAMDAKQAAAFEKMLRRDARGDAAAAETLWQFRRVRANDRGIRSADFLAWDFVRAAMLARAGATAGYLSEAEAEDFHLMIADDLRRHYSSWEELGESFLLGRWYWNGQGGDGERSTDLHDRNRQNVLLGVDGAWRAVPWNMPLGRSRMLFADALAEDPAAVFGFEILGTAPRPWAERLRAEVRQRTPLLDEDLDRDLDEDEV